MTHNFTHNVTTETEGSFRMVAGEVDDDVREVVFCHDCSRELSDSEIEQDRIDADNPFEAAGFRTFGFDEQGHLVFFFENTPDFEPRNLVPGITFVNSSDEVTEPRPGAVRTWSMVDRRFVPVFFTPEDFGESSVAPWEQ